MKRLTISVAVGAAVLGTAALAGAATAHAQTVEVPMPSVVESEDLPQLPNYFRDCWEPFPAHCVRPPGLLWFGDATTLRHEHGAFRVRRVRAAASR